MLILPRLNGPRAPRVYCMLMVGLFISTFCGAVDPDETTKGESQFGRVERRYAVHSIEFVIHQDSTGGTLPTETELLSVINSRACDFSLTSRLLRSITYQTISFDGVPPGIVTTLLEFYTRSTENELRWFNKAVASFDVQLIKDFFTQQGYHDARVRYHFTVSRDRRQNSLAFIIRTGKQYALDTIAVVGVDSIPMSIRSRILEVVTDHGLVHFSEPALRSMSERMLAILHDSGYAFARREQIPDPDQTDTLERRTVDRLPLVSIDTLNKRDSVTIYLEPQSRYRFGDVTFIDSTHGYPFVVNSLKRLQLEFEKGQWYNLSILRRSEAGIYALGPFDRVAIDTSASGDTIHTSVFCSYRRNWELVPSIFVNNTFPDNFNNLGADINYLNRNTFHDAQLINLFGRFTWRNFDYAIFNRLYINFEYEFGLAYTQPDWLRISSKRVDGSAQFSYSFRNIIDPFKLITWKAVISNWVRLNNNLSQLQFDVVVEAQSTRNYLQAANSAFENRRLLFPNRDTVELRNEINEVLDLYKKLDSYVPRLFGIDSFGVTSVAFSLNYFTDERNDIFFPSRGYTFNLLSEFSVPLTINGFGVSTLTNFIRLQGGYTRYVRLNNQLVGAWKIRAGHISWLDPRESIVPLDRHYFAGGATSIRSFLSRHLGHPGSNDTLVPLEARDLASMVGWASIVELSAELRYTFPFYSELGDFFAEKLSRVGLTLFTDIGNAFNRLTPSSYGRAKVDVFNPLNYAWAIGAGINYTTPVGPFRFDVATSLYDPTNPRPRYHWIFNRISDGSLLNELTVQISLGYAF